MRGAHHQRLKIIDVIGLLFLQFFHVLKVDQQLLFRERLLKGTFAMLFLEFLEKVPINLGVEQELKSGKEQEKIVFHQQI